MSAQLNVRDVPDHIRKWIDDERHRRKMSQKDFVLSLLEQACETDGQQFPLFADLPPSRQSVPEYTPFTYVDLFAGIGGFRVALDKLGGRCLFSCEWDKYAQKTYRAWFGEAPHGDITKLKAGDIPDHDILAAGFPCQPFSIAGVSKKASLGHAHGFKCAAQGTLFFQLATIIEMKRPPILFLENVKNLKSHDKGRTWEVIKSTLESLDYWLFSEIIDAAGYVPQHRERIFIVGFDRRVFRDHPPFTFPEPPSKTRLKLREVLEKNPPAKYTLTDHLWNYLQEYAARHRAKGNGFGFGLADLNGITRTLSASSPWRKSGWR